MTAAAGAGTDTGSLLAPLRRYWHPVEDSAAVGSEPVAVTLLEEGLVLSRSQGRVRVDADSRPEVHVDAYRAEDRYGLVWVALEDPVADIAPFPEYSDDNYRSYLSITSNWNASAGRFTENGLDVTHFAWVHPGTLGDRDDAECPAIDIDVTSFGFEYAYSRESLESPFATGGRTIHSRTMHHIPFTRRRVLTSDAGHSVQFVTASPVRARQCRIWMIESRDHHLTDPIEPYIDFSCQLLEQDRRIVESQRPEMLPIDLTTELHLRGPDQVALTYRRLLADAGVADV